MILDNFGPAIDSIVAPARNCFPIIPSDTGTLPALPKAVYVGTGGTLVVRTIDAADDVTFANVPNGTTLDIRVVAVRATGTSANDLVGLA